MSKHPELDYAAPPEDSLLSQPTGQTPESAVSPQSQGSVEQISPVAEEAGVKAYSEGGLQIPAHFKDAPTPEQEEGIQDLVNNKGFTVEAARQRVLKGKYIKASPPAGVDTREKGRNIIINRRKLGSNQKNTADGDKRVEAIYGKPGEIS